MLIPLAKAPATALIQSSRLTCNGMQYIVADFDAFHVVTATDANVTCSCGFPSCSNLQVVQVQRDHDATSDTHRTAYVAFFDLSHGD